MVMVRWMDGLAFQATNGVGRGFVMDSTPQHGGRNAGLSPVEALLAAAAACSAMDVVSILQKKRQTITRYRVEVDGELEDGDVPRPFKTISVHHVLQGPNLDPEAVARAVELSDEKYCKVIATLRATPEVTMTWAVEEEAREPSAPRPEN